MGFRDYYLFTFEELYQDSWKTYPHEYYAMKDAKRRIRMYANLFTRDLRKTMLTPDSVCKLCGSKEELQLDHIIPVTRSGKNRIENIQILCRVCNRQKGNKI
jgi:5-methylcytosine-specific restriction endonuclease McrA